VSAPRLYREAERDFGDVAAGRRDETVGERARGGLTELLALSIGRIAPGIEGPGVDGQPLALRDYRGKVVVLAFTTTGADAVNKPLRALVERHKDEPFAVLGVYRDLNKAAVVRAMAVREATWKGWWDGPQGPIFKAWNVKVIPSIVVLDARGVIRFRHLLGEALDEAVDRLLAEMKAQP
jgi:hypothetical protein